MRAVSGAAGPDISAFQQSYNTSVQSDMLFDDEEPPEGQPYPQPAATPPLSPSEPYRPDMLPRSYGTPEPQLQPAPAQSPIDSRLEALRREMRREEATQPRSFGNQEPAPTIQRREPSTSSLRESILRKPLSSLYNKD